MIFVFDGLKGLSKAVKRKYPRALTQRCVVHQVRNTLAKARNKHKAELADDLRTIYKNVEDSQEALDNLKAVKNKWDQYYPGMFDSWEENFEDLTNFLAFPEYLQRYVYTTNWLERINKENEGARIQIIC